jgi:hypothetical protein
MDRWWPRQQTGCRQEESPTPEDARMSAQSQMWEIVIAILVPLLVMSAALLMERVERHTVGAATSRGHRGMQRPE